MKKKYVWTIIMIIGILMIVSAAGLVINNALTAQRSGKLSSNVLLELEQVVSSAANDSAMLGTQEKEQDVESQQLLSFDVEQPLPEVTVNEHDYIGILDISRLGLTLPIMSEFSYDNLKIAPTRYYGEISSHDLVICAHNYSSHFGQLKKLQAGDEVHFKDMTGTIYSYAVSKVETISPTAIEEVISGENDLVLLTCTSDGSARVIVRCDIVD